MLNYDACTSTLYDNRGGGFESVKICFSCNITNDKDNVLQLETHQVCTYIYTMYIYIYIHTQRMSWVRVPLEAAHFTLKMTVLGELIALC